MTLLRSQIIVGCCDAIIASLHRHDYHSCPCGRMAIDGGLDYLRVVGDYPFSIHRIEVEEKLSRDEQRAVIATYIAIYRAYEDGRKNRGVPRSVLWRYQPSWFTNEDAKRAVLTQSRILGILIDNELVRAFYDRDVFLRFEPLKPLEIRDV